MLRESPGSVFLASGVYALITSGLSTLRERSVKIFEGVLIAYALNS